MKTFALCGEVLTPEQASPEQNFDHRVKLLTPLFQHLSMEPAYLCKPRQFLAGTAGMIGILHELKLRFTEEQNRNCSFTRILVPLLQGTSKISVATNVVNNG